MEDDKSVPVLDWILGLPRKAGYKIYAKLERLESQGHKLRRPEADYLVDDIFELRIIRQGIQYRILYFYHGKGIIVLAHGIIKKSSKVPKIEIRRAQKRKKKFKANPSKHTASY
jgi:phage-related protein